MPGPVRAARAAPRCSPGSEQALQVAALQADFKVVTVNCCCFAGASSPSSSGRLVPSRRVLAPHSIFLPKKGFAEYMLLVLWWLLPIWSNGGN